MATPLHSHLRTAGRPAAHTMGSTPPPPPPARTAACLMPGVNRQQLLERAQQLEAEAAAAHVAAQQLNKRGLFEEAKAQYAQMRHLDREALELTRLLGCAECAAAPAHADGRAAAAADGRSDQEDAGLDEASRALYKCLYVPQPWPATAGGGLPMAARARGSILACLTCDAAATGVAWIYDVRQLAALQEPEGGLEFFEPVQSPFLAADYGSGRNSPYGEQTLVLLASLAKQQGGLDVGAYAAAYYECYMQEGGFDGYMNASTVAFLRTYGRGLRPPATGADDAQADCIARLAPLVAAYAGDDRLMQLVSAATRVTQGAPTAVAWACAAAAVLERLLQGATAAAAVADTVQELRQQHELQQGRMPIDAQLAAEVADHMHRVLQLRDVPHAEAVEQLGRNCHLPNSCQTPLHAVLHHEWRVSAQAGIQQQLLVAAVRDALAAGGCCASRAGFVGACIGAMQGVECVPPDWRRRYEAAAEVQRHADALCTARGGVMGGL